jgi:hypothetical protein
MLILLGCTKNGNNEIQPDKLNQIKDLNIRNKHVDYKQMLREAEGQISIKIVKEIFGNAFVKASEELIAKSKINLKSGDEVFLVKDKALLEKFLEDKDVDKVLFVHRKNWKGDNEVDYVECNSRVAIRQEDPNDPTSRWLLVAQSQVKIVDLIMMKKESSMFNFVVIN